MAKFRIQSHGRLQEWVAEEKGYFKDEGLDYEFLVKPIATWSSDIESTESAPAEVQRGAFESRMAGDAILAWPVIGRLTWRPPPVTARCTARLTPLRHPVFMLLPVSD